MNAHASMNRIFRLVWNETLSIWVAVAETARGRGKRSVRALALLAPLTALAAGPGAPGGAPDPAQLPTGGRVTAGVASIVASPVRSAPTLTVLQDSVRAALTWDSFNLGSAAQVNFVQPGRDAITLNTVLDSNPSQIGSMPFRVERDGVI